MIEETNTPIPRPRRVWLRRVLKALVCLVLLASLLGLLAMRWLRSSAFNQFVAGKIEQGAKDYGVNVAIGDFGWSWDATTATLREVTVKNATTGQPIATVKEAVLALEIVQPYSARQAILRSLQLSGVDLHISLDAQGQTNFAGLQQPPKKADEFFKVINDQLKIELTNSRVHYSDQARNFDAELQGLQASLLPLASAAKRYQVNLSATGQTIRYEGRAFSLDELQTTGTLDENGWQCADLQVRTALGQAKAQGQLTNWRAPDFAFNIEAAAEMAETMRVFAPQADIRGHVSANGRIAGGKEKAFTFAGQSTANELQFGQTRLREVAASEVRLTAANGKVAFTGERVRASGLQVGTAVKLANLALNGVQGEVVGQRVTVKAPASSIGRVEWQGGQVSEATVRGIQFAIEGRQFDSTGEVTIKGGEIELGKQGKLLLGRATGRTKIDNDKLDLANLTVSLLGGTASGMALIPFTRAGTSTIKAQYNDLLTDNLLALGLVKPEQVPLKGKVNGTAEISFLNAAADRPSGVINAQFTGAGVEGLDGLPLNGTVAVLADKGAFNVTQMEFKTDALTLTGHGAVDVAAASDLSFQLVASDASQLTTIARIFAPAQKFIAEYEPLLTGELSFVGRLGGPPAALAVTGELKASAVGMKDALLGSLTGQLLVSAQQLRVQNGLLSASNGGTVRFAVDTPLGQNAANTGEFTATLDRLELETLLGLAGAPAALDFVTGNVAGELRLTGLPNAAQGGGKLNLLDAQIVKQAAELAQLDFQLDGQTILIERLETRLLQSSLLASGKVNLQDKRFLFKGNARQMTLARLAEAFELTTANAQLNGTADAEFQVSGATDKLDDLQVELTAYSKNVRVNERDTGELKLTARTSAAGRIEAELVTGILATAGGKPETIRGSIELRKAGKPVTIESDLIDLDVNTLAQLLAPAYAEAFKGKLNGRLLVAGPVTDTNGQSALAGLQGGLQLTSIELMVRDNPLTIAVPLEIKLANTDAGQQLSLAATKVTGPGVDLTLGGTLGWQDEAKMDFSLNGLITLAALPQLIEDVRLDGAVFINNARITGTAETPLLAGEILLKQIGFAATDAPAAITAGNGRIVLNGDNAQVDSFKATVNEGALELNGGLNFAKLQPKDWKFNVKASAVEVIYDEVRATLNGTLQLTGNPQGQQLTGRADVTQAEYTGQIDLDGITTGRVVSSSLGNFSAPGIGRNQTGLPPITLNVRVDARDSVIIRDDEINTVATALLNVSGQLSDPTLTGRVSAEGGTVRFRGQRYEVSSATLDLLGGGNPPVLALRAEGNTSGYRVYMGFVGPLDQIDLTLRTEPELTRDEILSLIATGRTESRTVGGADPLLSSVGTAASLLTTQVTKPAEKALGIIGINRFQIDPVIRPNTNPAARATIGAQLARSLYFTFATNLSADQFSTYALEYTLSNNFSAVASFAQGGSANGQGLQQNNDFVLEIRGRKRFALGFKPGGEPNLANTDPLANANPVPVGVRLNLPKTEVQVVTALNDLANNQRLLRELLPVKTQGFSRSLARLGERRLKNYLQERGYFFAEVSSRCAPANCQGEGLKLLYDVEPGERYQLTDIRLESEKDSTSDAPGKSAFTLAEVEGALQSREAHSFGGIPFVGDLPLLGGFKRGITSNERVKADVETIKRALLDRGYREPRVRSRFAVTADNGLIVVFAVDPGVQSRVAEVVVSGNAILSASELRRVIPVQNGAPFSLTQAATGVEQIRQLYAQRGFLEASADFEIVTTAANSQSPDQTSDQAPLWVRLEYRLNEGTQARITEVAVNGTTKTRLSWVKRYYNFRTGEVVTPTQLRNTQRDLYATGAFREVNVRPELIDPAKGEYRLNLNLTEAKPLLFVYGVGYSTDVGARGLLELTNTNIGGTLDSATLRLRGSAREQFAQFLFTDLRPFGSRWPGTFSVFYNRNGDLRPFTRRRENIDGKVSEVTDDTKFGLQRFAIFFQTERRFSDTTSVRFRYNLERANLFNFEQNFPETEITRNERAVRLGSFGAGVTRDTRDNLLNPTRGQLVSADNLTATSWLGGNESFNKFQATYQRYYTFSPFTRGLKDSTIAVSAKLGLGKVIRTADRNGDGVISESERRLPISERFFSGGATTLRGFRFETAGPQGILDPRPVPADLLKPGQTRFELPTLVPLGGDALTVFNFELRYPLTKKVRLVPFYDVGNVFYRLRDLNWSGMTNTFGVGIRFNTPLGPIGVDYGWLLDPPSFQYTFNGATARIQQPRGAFHIRLGQSF